MVKLCYKKEQFRLPILLYLVVTEHGYMVRGQLLLIALLIPRELIFYLLTPNDYIW